MKKLIMAILLCFCMAAVLIPTTAFAAEGGAIQLGTGGIKDPSRINDPTEEESTYCTPNSYIYFGKNEETPIKWRVLDADKANDGSTAGMFLLSEHLLGNTVFGDNGTWQNSTAQQWCKNFASNQSNFSQAEQSAMLGVEKTSNGDGWLYDDDWGGSSLTEKDKMFFLSARELADYVGGYSGAPGLATTFVDGGSGVWWLRSPWEYDTNKLGTVGGGSVLSTSANNDRATRPAFNLNLNSVLFTSAAVGGKSSGDVGGDAIFESSDYTGNEWKLTLLDADRNFAAKKTAVNGKVLTVSYTGAATGANEYISAIIKDNSGNITHYGRLKNTTEAADASGTVNIDLSGVTPAATDMLYVFSEQYNGDYKTDYASALVNVPYEEIAANVSYTAADGSEKTDKFSNIYNAFDKANEVGTATVTLQKDITSGMTKSIAVTGNVTVELNGKRLSPSDTDVWYTIDVKSGKLTVNGSGQIKRVIVRNGGDAEINSGRFSDFRVEDGGNAVIKGGSFYSLMVYGEGRSVGQLLADGYAYRSFNDSGFWSTIAEREKQGLASVNVREAPIKSAGIAWSGEGTPVIYRNGENYLDVKVTYELADASKQITYSDFVNGNNRRRDSKLYNNFYQVYNSEIGEIIAEDGEVEYYTVLKCDGYEYKSNALKFILDTCSHPEGSLIDRYDDGRIFCGRCNLLIGAKVTAADGDMLGYTDIKSAIELAQENEGSTVKLISEKASTYASTNITVTGGRFTVDFNGKKAYYSFEVNGGDVTFTSSVKQADAEDPRSTIEVSGADAKATIDGKIKLNEVRALSGTLKINSTESYIGRLSIEGGKTDVDGARIDVLNTYGGEAVIKNVKADSLTMFENSSGGSEYNISIVSGEFNSFTCLANSGYTVGKAMASGSRVGLKEGSAYYYENVKDQTEGANLVFEVCDHKDKNGSYVLNGNPCPYCKEEIAATVSYTAADGSERTDLFSDIYDAFDKANEAGTATVTLQKDITSGITKTIAVTGNVTVELNGKKLLSSDTNVWYTIEVKSGKLTVNGNGTIKHVIVRKGGDAEINGGSFSDFKVGDGGNAVIKGGAFSSLTVYGEGRSVGQLLADGYAYRSLNDSGFWSTIAEREKQVIANVDVREAPIKSASIAWDGEGTPVIYRNGANDLDVKVTYELTDASKQITYSDFVNGNNHSKDYKLSDIYFTLYDREIGEIIAEDGEVEYYAVLKCDGYEYKSNALKLILDTCSHPQSSFIDRYDDGNVYCGRCGLLIEAKVTAADGGLLGYGDIESAIELAQKNEGSTVKLISEKASFTYIIVTGGRFTVDFNGKKANYSFEVTGGDVTFTSPVKQADLDFQGNIILVDGADTKVTIDGKIKLRKIRAFGGTLTINSTESYIGELSIEGAKTDVDGARIGTLNTFDGEAVIKNVTVYSLTIYRNSSGGSKHNISIVSGEITGFTCSADSGYTVGTAMASGSRVRLKGDSAYYYENVKDLTEDTDLVFEVCDHKDKNGGYALDGNTCLYCKEEFAAAVSYTAADGSERTDLFGDIYDAFDKAKEVGTATVTLYKDIADSEVTREITVTGDVTVALNGKKLGGVYGTACIEVSDGGTLTVGGDGTVTAPIDVNQNSKLIVKSGYFNSVIIQKDGSAVIYDGFVITLIVYGKAEINGGSFCNLQVSDGDLYDLLGENKAFAISNGELFDVGGFSSVSGRLTAIDHSRHEFDENHHCKCGFTCTEHKGGTATCTEKAKCEICGAEYGEMLPHSYTEKVDKQYLKSAATCTEKAVYYTSCADCGLSSKGTKSETTFEYGNALGHKYGEWVSNGDGTHTRVCANDSKHTETKDCHGGKATCTAKAICEDCGAEYGEPLGHKYIETVVAPTYASEGYTVFECTRCKHRYYENYVPVMPIPDVEETAVKKTTYKEVDMSWKAISGVDGYYVECYIGGQWTKFSYSANGDSVEAKLSGLSAGIKYKVRIAAYAGSYTGKFKYFYIDTIPAPVWNITTVKATDKAVEISWNRNTRADGYKVEWYIGNQWSAKTVIGSDNISAVIDGLRAGKRYKVRVSAYKGELYSPYTYGYIETLPLPSKVTGIKQTVTASSFTLTWDKNESADGYTVEYYAGGKWNEKILTGNDKTTVTIGSLKGYRTYKVRIKAYKGELKSTFDDIYITTAPTKVNGLKVKSATDNKAIVIWNADTKADGYNVGYYIGGKWVEKTLKGSANATVTIDGLRAGKRYKVRVSAYKGELYSPYTYGYIDTLPSKVTGITQTVTASSFTLTWDKNESADGYTVQYYADGKWNEKTLTGNDKTTVTIGSLKGYRTYKVRINAYKGELKSTVNDINITTAPTKVNGLKVKSATDNKAIVVWNADTKADGYNVEYYIGGKWVEKTITDNKTAMAELDGLTPYSTYKVRVRAYKGELYGDYSYTAVTAVLSPVNGIEVVSEKSNSITVKWDKNDSADGYKAEIYTGGKWVEKTLKGSANATVTIDGLKAGSVYKVRIAAYKGANTSAYTYANVNTAK